MAYIFLNKMSDVVTSLMFLISELHSSKRKRLQRSLNSCLSTCQGAVIFSLCISVCCITISPLFPSGEALQCYTCMGSNNDDCNRQGSKSCPSYSDACAVVVGHDSESNSDSVVAFHLNSLLSADFINLCLY